MRLGTIQLLYHNYVAKVDSANLGTPVIANVNAVIQDQMTLLYALSGHFARQHTSAL